MNKLLVGIVCFGLSLSACAGGHYVPGIEGIKGASVPPPGNYYLGYLVNYDIDTLKAPGTDTDIPSSNNGTVTAIANRLVHITNTKLLGADYGVEAIIPVINKDLDFNAAGYANEKTAIGDIFIGPVVLGWHGDRWDAVGAAGIWLDTANSAEMASAGNGYRSVMLTGGGTAYLNVDKSLSVSALMRYEINSKDDAGLEPGDQISFEWGIGKKINRNVELGLVGYDQWQVSKDKGTGSTSSKFSKHAIGVEGSYFSPTIGGVLKAAYYNEYAIEAGSNPAPSGNTIRLTLIKPF